MTIAGLVEQLKSASSKWTKTQANELGDFSWQRGYACFSVGPQDLETLIEYIEHQRERHASRTFQTELRWFLQKYGVAYDEAYVWD